MLKIQQGKKSSRTVICLTRPVSRHSESSLSLTAKWSRDYSGRFGRCVEHVDKSGSRARSRWEVNRKFTERQGQRRPTVPSPRLLSSPHREAASFVENCFHIPKEQIANAWKEKAEGYNDEESVSETIYTTKMNQMSNPQTGFLFVFSAQDKRAEELCCTFYYVMPQESKDIMTCVLAARFVEIKDTAVTTVQNLAERSSWLLLSTVAGLCLEWRSKERAAGGKTRAAVVLSSAGKIQIQVWNFVRTAIFSTNCNQNGQSVRKHMTNEGHENSNRGLIIIHETSWMCPFGSLTRLFEIFFPLCDRGARWRRKDLWSTNLQRPFTIETSETWSQFGTIVSSLANIIKEEYRSLFTACRFACDPSMVEAVNEPTPAVGQELGLGNHGVLQESSVQQLCAGQPLLDDRPWLLTYI